MDGPSCPGRLGRSGRAASATCPLLVSALAPLQSRLEATVNLDFAGAPSGSYTLTVTSVTGPGFGPLPDPVTFDGRESQLTLTGTDPTPATGRVVVAYTITTPGQRSCPGTFSFSFSTQ